MRLVRTWIVFGLCLAVVLAAMGWISLTVLRLESAQAEAQQRALFEENVRLALWRMDSALTPIIAQETARPHFSYTSFYAAEKAYRPVSKKAKRLGIIVPSPLLTQKSDFVLLYFQFEPSGALTSPQAPAGNMKKLALESYITERELDLAAGRLSRLRNLVRKDDLAAGLPKEEAPVRVALNLPDSFRADQTVVNREANSKEQQQKPKQDAQPLPVAQSGKMNIYEQIDQQVEQQMRQQKVKGQTEWAARAGQVGTANLAYQGKNPVAAQTQTMRETIVIPSGHGEGVMKPLWIGNVLLLARRISVGGEGFIQGCWLDWKATRGWMLETVKDLLPNADLEPARAQAENGQERMLAALPVRLLPGEVPSQPIVLLSPVRFSLLVAWICVLAGAGSVGLLLYGAVSLGERRGAFVSAVTHELRTPLTTFQMYSEMLEKGMVEGEEKRRTYLKTLCTEAERLSHLVENVLSYARLEKRRTMGRIEEVALGDLLDRLKDRLAQRAEQAGMELVVDAGRDLLDRSVRTDVSAVDQILFNLVDNACKYAALADEKKIHIEAHLTDGFVSLRVRDHGPGVARDDSRRLFKPFSKSARDAANSAPGVGLGLALSRRLARSMGGDLRLHHGVQDGACFILTLPTA